jgi:hypothetical protein
VDYNATTRVVDSQSDTVKIDGTIQPSKESFTFVGWTTVEGGSLEYAATAVDELVSDAYVFADGETEATLYPVFVNNPNGHNMNVKLVLKCSAIEDHIYNYNLLGKTYKFNEVVPTARDGKLVYTTTLTMTDIGEYVDSINRDYETNYTHSYDGDASDVTAKLVYQNGTWDLDDSSLSVDLDCVRKTTTVSFNQGELPQNMDRVTFQNVGQLYLGDTFTPNVPSYEGSWVYQLAGWSDGEHTYGPNEEIPVTEGLTLTPIWKLYSPNGDGVFNLYDAIQIMEKVDGGTGYPQEQLDAMDVNGDGNIDLYDAIRVMEIVDAGSAT